MKKPSEITACVCDYGTLGIALAEKLAETYARVFLYTPTEDEFKNAKDCCLGVGVPGVERLNDMLDPEHFDEIDLWIFPDIGWGGTQKTLRKMGKAVWGSMGGDDFELYRTRFLDLLKQLKLPVCHSVTITGLNNLEEHLKKVENKWIKVNRFRGNMETWKHIDWVHSEPIMNGLAEEFMGVKDQIIFVVQDPIDTTIEIGYDGLTVDGQFPEMSFQGYEKKNDLYLGSLLKYSQLPEQIREINEALAPVLKKMGYRNFIATEIRVKDDVPYFIDPTMRMPGQTGEQLLETCTNLAEVIWYGANGQLVQPKYRAKFSAEATLHYTAGDEDWYVLKVPDDVKQWIKLYRYCVVDGVCHFPPRKNDELGVVLGLGDTVDDAIQNLKDNFEKLKGEPVKINPDGFVDLIKSINEAQDEGLKFSDKPLPEPDEIIT